jgi:hypothetical protein
MVGDRLKKRNICFLFNNEQQSYFCNNNKLLKFYSNLYPKKRIYLINIQNFIFEKEKECKKINLKKKSIIYFKPKNFKDFYNFSKNKKLIFFGLRLFRLKYLFLEIIIKLLAHPRILVIDGGYVPISIKSSNTRSRDFLKFLIMFKIKYFFFRLLATLNIISKFEICFESSQTRIEQIKNSLSYKIDNLLKVNIFSYYKKIIRINSNLKLKNEKIKKKLKYIVFCDDGFDHPDRTVREFVSIEDREMYYEKLFIFFKQMEKIYNKKILFCKHPRSKYPNSNAYNRIKESFLINDKTSEKDIMSAYIFLLNSTSLISKAILFNKKIAIIKSKFLGEFINNRIIKLAEETKLSILDIDKTFNYMSKKKIKIIDNNIKKNFIKNNIFLNYNRLSNAQIIRNNLDKL